MTQNYCPPVPRTPTKPIRSNLSFLRGRRLHRLRVDRPINQRTKNVAVRLHLYGPATERLAGAAAATRQVEEPQRDERSNNTSIAHPIAPQHIDRRRGCNASLTGLDWAGLGWAGDPTQQHMISSISRHRQTCTFDCGLGQTKQHGRRQETSRDGFGKTNNSDKLPGAAAQIRLSSADDREMRWSMGAGMDCTSFFLSGSQNP